MTDMKQWKQLTHVNLKDGRVITTERNPKEIGDWIMNNTHIMIEGELHSKYDIINAVLVQIDDLESYILSQTKEFQDKIRAKKLWLKKEMGKEMSIEYAKSYVENTLSKDL